MLKRFSEVEDKSGLRFEMDMPDITGFSVNDKNGDDVGEVQDLVYNTDTNTVNHAIVGRGWLASIVGDRQAVVPFDRMTVNPNERTVRLDISRDELQDFPDWSDLTQEGFGDKIRSWWDQRRQAA